ncbi:MAG: Type fimbrial assembly protein PilC [Ilumatobacteraceae bacterium]|nr:Type fimbrial assembly protein PilC [Ilumatobacteraceae bacterium]MCU1391183.1 Type fimbrial assembly protein PilC [Ilumatobacteraceae bacterium]
MRRGSTPVADEPTAPTLVVEAAPVTDVDPGSTPFLAPSAAPVRPAQPLASLASLDGPFADVSRAAPARAASAGAVADQLDPIDSSPGASVAGSRSDWLRAQFSFSIGRSVKGDVIMAFSRQLASFLEAGIPVLESLEIVGAETSSDQMRGVIADIRESIQRGMSFSDAVAKHPKVFPSYYRAMVLSAEYTGRLDVVLNQLATYLERDLGARRQIKSALTYPIVVLGVAIIAMIVMSLFVLPKFSGLYRSLGAKLPLPTRMLLGITDFLTKGWPILLGGGGLLWLGTYAVIGGARGKERRDRLAMRLPVIGNLFHLISLERFCRVLAALATAGIPLPDAIDVSAESTNNSVFRTKLAVVRDVLIRGGGLAAPIIESGIFPIAARQMIGVGERTGALGQQLGKASSYYEREVSFHIKRATDLFEPMVILLVGLIVGFVAVAQVAAMYSIFGQVKH